MGVGIQPDTEQAEQVRSLSPNLTSSFTSPMYHKLANPFNHLLKHLPVVDGNDACQLCNFLLRALNILKISSITEPGIYGVLYPYCRGEMLAFLIKALTARENFDVIEGLTPVQRARFVFQERPSTFAQMERF
jgi:hypothetical protein